MIFVCSWFFFFFKQKTAYEMRISDWSSDVCSSDLAGRRGACSNSIFALLLAIGFDLLGQLRNRYVIAGNGRQLLRYPLRGACVNVVAYLEHGESGFDANDAIADRKSTRLNSSH